MQVSNRPNYIWRDFYSGKGWIGGSLPPDPNPNSPDGRTKVLGEPAPMEVRLLDGKTRRQIARARSKADGTWKFDGLKEKHWFAVEFCNHNGVYTDNNGAPYNSFIQDFIFAMPPAINPIGPFWGHGGESFSVDGLNVGDSLTIINPDAADGITGWAVTTGTLQPRTGGPKGTHFMGVGARVIAHQDIDIPTSYFVDVDLGLYRARVDYQYSTWGDDTDHGRVGIAAIDSTGDVLDVAYTTYLDVDVWTTQIVSLDLPAGTRKVRIIMDGVRDSGTNLDAYWTGFEVSVFKT